jgi:hypothetical protein
MIAIFWQVHEMINVYGPIHDQAIASKVAADAATKQSENSNKALVVSSRAWIGPSSAKFDAPPSVGKDIEVTVFYQNTGRQPAQSLVVEATTFIGTDEEIQKGVIMSRILSDTEACFTKQSRADAWVAYPTIGLGSYWLITKFDKALIDQNVIDNKSTLFLDGCFIYSSFEQTRHSAFCFFFNSKTTKPESLNFCLSGNRAD